MRHCLTTESRHSVAVTLSRISSELHSVYGREVLYCLKFQRTHNTIDHVCTLAGTRNNDIPGSLGRDPSWVAKLL